MGYSAKYLHSHMESFHQKTTTTTTTTKVMLKQHLWWSLRILCARFELSWVTRPGLCCCAWVTSSERCFAINRTGSVWECVRDWVCCSCLVGWLVGRLVGWLVGWLILFCFWFFFSSMIFKFRQLHGVLSRRERQTDTERQTGRQADRQAGRQAGR